MIEALTSTGYSIVEASWHTAAVFTKFYLLTVLFRLKDQLAPETLAEKILDESRYVVGTIVAVAVISLLLGVETRPLFPLISEGIALIYLGYLFWEF